MTAGSAVVANDGGARRGAVAVLVAAALAAVLLLAGCSHEKPSEAVMVVLADRSPTGGAELAAQRRHLTEVVIPLAVTHHAQVDLAAIVGDARRDPDPVAEVSFNTAAAQGNPIVAAHIVAEARTQLLDAFDKLFATPSAAHASDVAGALAWAAQTLANTNAPTAWHAVAVLSDADSTASPCNFSLVEPWRDLTAALGACYPAGVPQFNHADLLFLGAGSDPTGIQSAADTAGIKAFWQRVADNGGGDITVYGTVLGPPQ